MQNYNSDNRPDQNYNPNQNYNHPRYDPEAKTVYHPQADINRQQYGYQPNQQYNQQIPQQIPAKENNNTQLIIILLSICITVVVVVGALLIAFTSGNNNPEPAEIQNTSSVSESSTNSGNNYYVEPQTTEPITDETVVIDGPGAHDTVESGPYYYQKGVELPTYVYEYTASGKVVTEYSDSEVHMRKGPSTDYKSRKKLATGTHVTVYGEEYDENGQIWFYIYHGGKYGWIFGKYLKTY